MRIAFPRMKHDHGARVAALPRKELSVEVSKLGRINKALKTARDNAAAQLFHFIMDASRSRWRSARRSNARLPVVTSRSVCSTRCARAVSGSATLTGERIR